LCFCVVLNTLQEIGSFFYILGTNVYTKYFTLSQRRKNMQHIKSSDTQIEMLLRRALWNKGYRYRKNYKELPGKPDIALTKYKIAIFCDGEFFHGKDWEVLKPRLEKGNNSEFWIKKISRNVERDDEVNKQLLFLGWTVIRFWGKDIKKNVDECVRVVEEAIFDAKINDDFLQENDSVDE
jgi:DNA mismatch endonuclease, patch repair protein